MEENLELEIPVSVKLTVKREALLRLFDVFSGKVADKVNKPSEPAPAAEKPESPLALQTELALASSVKEHRTGRRRHRRIVLADGTPYSADNALELFRMFDIAQHYTLFHNVRKGEKREVVAKEGLTFCDILKKERGLAVKSYSAYDFENNWKTVELGA